MAPVDAVFAVALRLAAAAAAAECRSDRARFLNPYIWDTHRWWQERRGDLDGRRTPATTVTSRPFIIPHGEPPGATGKWAARLGPWTGAALAPLWPDWLPERGADEEVVGPY